MSSRSRRFGSYASAEYRWRRRVGIRDTTFEACSGFTRLTAHWIAQPPRAAFVTGLRPAGFPGKPPASYQIERQLSGWNLPALVNRAFGAHREWQARVAWVEPDLSSARGGRAVQEHSEVLVAFDLAKTKNALAIAEGGRRGDSSPQRDREFDRGHTAADGEARQSIPATDILLRPADPTHRDHLLNERALVGAPAAWAVVLTAILVPDAKHEVMGDLVRARDAAAQDLTLAAM